MPELAVRMMLDEDVHRAFDDMPAPATGDEVPLRLAEGIDAHQPLLLAEAAPLTLIFDIAKTVSVSVAAGIISQAIWERLKGRKPESVRLNRRTYKFDSEGQLREAILEELESGSRDD